MSKRKLFKRTLVGVAALLVGLTALGVLLDSDEPGRLFGETVTSSKEADVRTVKDVDGISCLSDETKYARCPDNAYFGKTMAEAQAAKKAKGEKRRVESAAAARAEAERVAEEQAALEAATAWIPEGWNQYGGENIYWQWNRDCDNSYTGCYGMDVVTKDGCSNLYVEIQLVDADGNAVGFSNDTIGALDPEQVAKLDFSSYEENASARMAEINCY